jgi:hypothetical protein
MAANVTYVRSSIIEGDKHYVDDVGTKFVIECEENVQVDIAKLCFYVKKPDGTKVEWPAIPGINRCMEYTIQEGDLNQKGIYKLQAYIENNDGSHWRGDTLPFRVFPHFDENGNGN